MNSIGHYTILNEIARGGMGVVYRAQDPSGRVFALKVLLEGDPNLLERFQREAELASQLVHPNVVRVHAHGVVRGRPYLVMDYVEGEDLLARLRRDGPLPELEARRLFGALGQGLAAAHARGIVHRDLKPQNVLLSGAEVYLSDFGLARRGPSTLTVTGELLGTPAYMAPEQARGERGIGPATDVYGLGATLYTALCGVPPFRAPTLFAVLDKVSKLEPEPLRSLRPDDLSPALEALVHACLAKDPTQRPVLSNVLERLAAAEEGAGSRALLGVALVAVLAAGALGGSWLALRGSGEESPPATASSQPPETPLASVSAEERERQARLARLLDEARAARAAGEWGRARARLESALETAPRDPAALLFQGELAFATGDYATAESLPERLGGASDEVQAAGHYWRGRALLRRLLDLPPDEGLEARTFEEAREALSRSRDLSPSARAEAWLGQAELRLKRRGAAEDCLARAKALDPQNLEVFTFEHALAPSRDLAAGYPPAATYESLLIAASYALEAGEFQRADEALEAALAQRSDRGGVLACRADGLTRRSRLVRGPRARAELLDTAAGLASEGLRLVPPGSRASASLLATRGTALRELQRYQESERDLRRSLEIHDRPQVRRLLAMGLLERVVGLLGSWQIKELGELLDEAGQLGIADMGFRGPQFMLRGRLRAMAADYESAEELFRGAEAELDPKGGGLATVSPAARGSLFQLWILRGRSRLEAVRLGYPAPLPSRDLLAALERGDDPYVRSLLARALRLEAQPEAAAEAVDRAKQALATASPQVRRVGLALAEGRDEDCLDADPGNPHLLGGALERGAEVQALIRRAPRSSWNHPALGLGFARRAREGGSREASPALEALVQRYPELRELRFERGLLRARRGDRAGGVKDLERAREGHPLEWRKEQITILIDRIKRGLDD